MATLSEKIKVQKLFTLNKTVYFGTITDMGESEGTQGKVVVEDAIKVNNPDNFGEIVKQWVAAENSDKLKSPAVSGLYTLEIEDLDEDQMMIIDIIAAKAAQIIKNTLRGIQNKEILNIDVD